MLKSWCSVLLISIISGAVSTAMGGQPLETESARLAARGTLKVEAGLERQTSADGSEANLPAALEYSPADRVEIRWHFRDQDEIRATRQPSGDGHPTRVAAHYLGHEDTMMRARGGMESVEGFGHHAHR